jgi:pyruvate dehydrogenase E2 component (dihydrolipoamide acetyltransferase)
MAQLIKMPAVAADSATGAIAQWLKQKGDMVAVGDAIAEIETDKAVVEIAAEHAGVLARIVAPAGPAQLAVNAILGVLITEGEGEDEVERALAEGGVTGAPATTVSATTAPMHPASVVEQVVTQNASSEPVQSGRLLSSPAARRIAAEHQIDLRHVIGSGPRGRILKDDVQRAARTAVSHAVASLAPATQQTASPAGSQASQGVQGVQGETQRTAHTPMRRAIARRLSESKQTIPHFYLSRDCRMDALLALRREITGDGAQRVSVNDFIVRAAALALRAVPAVNVSWDDDALIHHQTADIAVAVATEGGLVTPIVRQADVKTLRYVSTEIAALATDAREHRLSPAQYTGGSMTVSNLGMYGVANFAAIINPPQACILAVGAAEKRAVVDDDGAIVAATVMTVTLSADHRAVDGAVAATWLAAFHQLIEHPVRILL